MVLSFLTKKGFIRSEKRIFLFIDVILFLFLFLGSAKVCC
jgi:hypothetical protein